MNSFYELGYINEIKGGFIYLLPGVRNEDLHFPEGKMEFNSMIENELPIKLASEKIQGIEPLSEGYLERFVKAKNNLNFPKDEDQLNLFSEE